MGRPSDSLFRRQSSTLHYQTFPTSPPKSKGLPPSETSSNDESRHGRPGSSGSQQSTPLPVKQLLVLAFASLSEQTALNSMSPYLPELAASFPEVELNQVGVYVGTIASAFALAQFATGFFWGWFSDRIGRKPVILTGTLLTAVCFLAFGFCRNLAQAIVVQALMGLVNGNQGVVSTCLGEITDRSNQSRAFIYLPVIYGLGGITGPLLGGVLAPQNPIWSSDNPHPFLPPNFLAFVVLILDLLVLMFFLEESLEEAQHLPPLGKRVMNMFSWIWQFSSSTRPSYLRVPSNEHEHQKHANASRTNGARQVDGQEEDDEGEVSEDESDSDTSSSRLASFMPENTTTLSNAAIFNRDTMLLMITYFVFQLCNIAFNSLYPIFGQAPEPLGRNLTPSQIGISLAFAGATTIVFQLGVFGKLRERLGNKVTYRGCLGILALTFILIPWVGYKQIRKADGSIADGRVALWIELGFVLLLKTLSAVGCLTSFLLLITNSAPNHSVLGTLNGIAQTLSAAGRAAGPFLAGGLFSLASKVQPKGEALAFGVFGGVGFVGFLLAFGIRGKGLEAEGFDDEESGSGEGEDDDDDDGDDDDIHGDGDEEAGQDWDGHTEVNTERGSSRASR